jgi:acetyltransferase-like isoleucine patch superfamily enzyme
VSALENLKKFVWKIPGSRLLFHCSYYFLQDLRDGRFRAVLFGGLANLLPDLLAFAFVRTCLWWLAGAKLQGCGTSSLRAGVYIERPKGLAAGHDLHVNRDSYLDASGGLEIGDHVTISVGCCILSMSHAGVIHERKVFGKTRIMSNSIIYAGAIILPGSTVQRYTVVAAGAVLKGDTVPGGIYAGVPALLKGIRTDIDRSLWESPAASGE